MVGKKVFIVLNLVFTLSMLFAEKDFDYFKLNGIKAKEIIISDRNKEKILILNEDQKQEFLKKLEVVKKKGPGKCLYHYRVNVLTEDGTSLVFFMNRITIGTGGDGTHYELKNDMSDLIESFYKVYDLIYNPLVKKTCLHVNFFAGGKVIICRDSDRCYVLEIRFGSGVSVLSIIEYDGFEKDGALFYGNSYIVFNGENYELYEDGIKYECRISDSCESVNADVLQNVKAFIAFHDF